MELCIYAAMYICTTQSYVPAISDAPRLYIPYKIQIYVGLAIEVVQNVLLDWS